MQSLMEDMKVSANSYAVNVIAKKLEEAGPVAENGVADEAAIGVTDYDCVVKMPELDPGRYTINVYAVIPFARIVENKHIHFNNIFTL